MQPGSASHHLENPINGIAQLQNEPKRRARRCQFHCHWIATTTSNPESNPSAALTRYERTPLGSSCSSQRNIYICNPHLTIDTTRSIEPTDSTPTHTIPPESAAMGWLWTSSPNEDKPSAPAKEAPPTSSPPSSSTSTSSTSNSSSSSSTTDPEIQKFLDLFEAEKNPKPAPPPSQQQQDQDSSSISSWFALKKSTRGSSPTPSDI
ncbi:hypothetical protein FZEAL_3174, partial [Fusarium zealandicum]